FATDDVGTASTQIGHAYFDPIDFLNPEPPEFLWNSAGALPDTTPITTGHYQVSFPGQTHDGASIVVTAVGANASFCQLLWTSVDSVGTLADVLCFDVTGHLTDSAFTMRYEWRGPSSVAGEKVHGYAWADEPWEPSYT